MKAALLAVNTPQSRLVFTGLVYTNPDEQIILRSVVKLNRTNIGRCGSKYVFCERIGGPGQADGVSHSLLSA